jgi:hypothetical protein
VRQEIDLAAQCKANGFSLRNSTVGGPKEQEVRGNDGSEPVHESLDATLQSFLRGTRFGLPTAEGPVGMEQS